MRPELLERVLFRLGTAESDEQLETAVNKFLTPVLLKITSSNESVRCKVRIYSALNWIRDFTIFTIYSATAGRV